MLILRNHRLFFVLIALDKTSITKPTGYLLMGQPVGSVNEWQSQLFYKSVFLSLLAITLKNNPYKAFLSNFQHIAFC